MMEKAPKTQTCMKNLSTPYTEVKIKYYKSLTVIISLKNSVKNIYTDTVSFSGIDVFTWM